MYELLQKIQALPWPKLLHAQNSPADLQKIKNFIRENNITKLEEFEAALATLKKNKQSKLADKTEIYARHCLHLSTVLLNIEQLIAKTWFAAKPGKSVGGDQLIPTIFDLLPANPDLLQEISQKLTDAQIILFLDKADYLVTTLIETAKLKIDLLENPNQTADQEKADDLVPIITKKVLLTEFQLSCKAYLIFLLEKSLHKKIDLKQMDEKQLSTVILETIQKSDKDPLIEKIRILADMDLTLSDHKLSEEKKYCFFIEKWAYQIDFLQKDQHIHFNMSIHSKHFDFNLFPNPFSDSAEKKLIDNIISHMKFLNNIYQFNHRALAKGETNINVPLL